MKGIHIGLLGVAFGAAACGDAEPEKIQAGATAQRLGVSHYQIERIGEMRVIHMFAKNGPNGETNFAFGDVELSYAKAGEVGFEGATLTEEDFAREPLVRIKYRDTSGYDEEALFRGREYEGVDCPQERAPVELPIRMTWHAAVTDQALAGFLDEMRLTLNEFEGNLVQDPEHAFDGGNHVGDCAGHRVLPHTSGLPYQSCFQYSQLPNQMIYNYNTSPGYYCTGFRDCWGGYAEGGNGKGSTNCCNGDCSHPSPGGQSQQNDCGGFSANGCKFTGDGCGCDYGCQGYYSCWNNCGYYEDACCYVY